MFSLLRFRRAAKACHWKIQSFSTIPHWYGQITIWLLQTMPVLTQHISIGKPSSDGEGIVKNPPLIVDVETETESPKNVQQWLSSNAEKLRGSCLDIFNGTDFAVSIIGPEAQIADVSYPQEVREQQRKTKSCGPLLTRLWYCSPKDILLSNQRKLGDRNNWPRSSGSTHWQHDNHTTKRQTLIKG